jgi:hypothetical protein
VEEPVGARNQSRIEAHLEILEGLAVLIREAEAAFPVLGLLGGKADAVGALAC